MTRALKTFAHCLAILACLISGSAFAEISLGDNFTFHSSANRAAGWTGPSCENPTVIARVRSRFASTEAAYWDSNLTMDLVDRPREIAFRDWVPTIIATRSCRADASLSDGRRVAVVYWVRSEQGFAGHGYGVDYCIVGGDWPYAYAPGCRELLPR
jgi:hypothetical protein